MPIRLLSTTPGNNNLTPPNGAPEGATNINQLTDIFRQLMADVRGFWETPSWRDMGHTPTFISSTSFSVTGDQRAFYFANQRIRITDSSTLYGTIASVAYTTVTTVTVTLDSGAITSSISAVALGLGDANKSLHYNLVQGTPTVPTADSILPAGMIAPYAGSTAPTGWLLCFGQAVSRTTYAALFTAIGTTYGSGDGSTTFNLPDLRGRSIFALDNMGGTDAGLLSVANTLGLTGGAQTKSGSVDGTALTVGQLPSHNHGQNIGGAKQTNSGGTGTSVTGLGATATGSTNNQTLTDSAGNGETHTHTYTNLDVMPPYILMNYIIKVA